MKMKTQKLVQEKILSSAKIIVSCIIKYSYFRIVNQIIYCVYSKINSMAFQLCLPIYYLIAIFTKTNEMFCFLAQT